MKTIKKKTWMPYFEEILTYNKTFDIRLGNFEGEKGDQIKFREYSPYKMAYSGRECIREIIYKLSLQLKIDTDFCYVKVLFGENFIKTFTNEGDTVLDITAGSGTTAVAAINTNRKFIIIEKEENYAQIAEMRIQEALQATKIKNKNLDDLL